jgi:hypothetical protein
MATTFVRHTGLKLQDLAQGLRRFRPGPESEGRYGSSCVPSGRQPQRHHSDPRIFHRRSRTSLRQKQELQQAMQNAGVVGAPTIWFTNKV